MGSLCQCSIISAQTKNRVDHGISKKILLLCTRRTTTQRVPHGLHPSACPQPGGADVPVTDANKAEFAALVRSRALAASDAQQSLGRRFRRGLTAVVPSRLIAPFAPAELSDLLSGAQLICWEDLKVPFFLPPRFPSECRAA